MNVEHKKGNQVDQTKRKMIKLAANGVIAGAAAPLLSLLPQTALAQSSMLSSVQGNAAQPSPVYFTKDISGAGVNAVFAPLNAHIKGKTAIKLHVGDPGNKNFLSPELVRGLCQSVNGTLCDSNVLYGGPRRMSDSHRAVADDHGFNFAEFDVLDENGSVELPIKGGNHLQTALMGKNIMDYESLIVFSHVKGHQMAGYGGAVKNIAMGIASRQGKRIIHGNGWQNRGEEFLERLVEYGKSMADARQGRIVYINVLNNLSTSCDCDSNAPPPVLDDIGIVASTDIVAVEKASLDLIYAKADSLSNALVRRIEDSRGPHQIQYAQTIGMGNADYELIEI